MLNFFKNKKISIPNNSFVVWEPCSKSHSEVVPGYSKYLLDLGYKVSILVEKERYKEGLFSRFQNENLYFCSYSRKDILNYFKNSNLSEFCGLLITTVGKLCDDVHFDEVYSNFRYDVNKNKIFMVEHESSFAIDKNLWKDDLIILRKLNYKGKQGVVINPHYFGEVKINNKNKITNFIMTGALDKGKKNTKILVDAVFELYKKGITNFKITIVGKGSIKNIPNEIRKFFDIKGRLPFYKMYEELEKADFLLTAYDDSLIRYNTSGTSGNFQLAFGFLKPVVILKSFSEINDFNESNSILYNKDEDYSNALQRCINMDNEEYKTIQNNLSNLEKSLYNLSLNNFKNLIKEKLG